MTCGGQGTANDVAAKTTRRSHQTLTCGIRPGQPAQGGTAARGWSTLCAVAARRPGREAGLSRRPDRLGRPPPPRPGGQAHRAARPGRWARGAGQGGGSHRAVTDHTPDASPYTPQGITVVWEAARSKEKRHVSAGHLSYLPQGDLPGVRHARGAGARRCAQVAAVQLQPGGEALVGRLVRLATWPVGPSSPAVARRCRVPTAAPGGPPPHAEEA